MESPDRKTPPSDANHRPRLLNTGIRDAPDKAAAPSMLASLERDGKLGGSAASARPGGSRKYLAPLAAALVLVGGAAAFVYRSSGDMVATASPAALASGTQRDVPITVAVDAADSAVAAASAAVAASSPAQIEVAAVASKALEPAALRPPSEASSGPPGTRNPLDRLDQPNAMAAPFAASVSSSASAAAVKKLHATTAATRPPAKVGASAKSVARADGKVLSARKARTTEEDADTELVAAMIARLDRRGANPTSPASERAAVAGDPGLAEKVRQCGSKTDLLDARRCRSKVCETHWGKSDACPASRAPKTLFGEHIDHGAPG